MIIYERDDKKLILAALGLVVLASLGLMECKHAINEKQKKAFEAKEKTYKEEIKLLQPMPKPGNTNLFMSLSNLTLLHFGEKDFIHIRDEDWEKLTNRYATNIMTTNLTLNFYEQ